jgi:hypothetical protein
MRKTTVRASLSKQVLRDLELNCRLRGSKQVLHERRSVADHRLTKILVLG